MILESASQSAAEYIPLQIIFGDNEFVFEKLRTIAIASPDLRPGVSEAAMTQQSATGTCQGETSWSRH